MSCENPEFRAKIFDLFEGSVQAEERKAVESHLETCADCRQLLGEYRAMSAGLKSAFTRLSRSHLSAEDVVAFADSPESLDKSKHDAIEHHLDICDTCAEKVEMLTAVNREMVQGRDRLSVLQQILDGLKSLPDFIAALTKKPIVITVATLLLITPVALFVGRSLLTVHPTIEFFEQGDASFLKSQMRTEGELPVIKDVGGYASIGLYFEPHFNDETYQLQLRDDKGKVMTETKLDERSYVVGQGFKFRLGTKDLSPGRYRLNIQISRTSRPEETSAEVYVFVLSR